MSIHHDRGAGPTLLVVPGLAATAGFLAEAVADLAADHRVVTVELPGHGRNTGGTASLAAAAEDVHRTVEALDLRDVTLLGWSLGATVAYGYLERFGAARTAGLVSVEQTPCLVGDDGWPFPAFGNLTTAAAAQFGQAIAADYGAFADNLVRGSFAAGADPDPAVVADLVAQAGRCDPAAVGALLADAVAADWRQRVSRLGVPTLLVHGARSQVYPGAVGGWLADAIPGARLETFAHSGHLPFVEERDRFTRTVREFVARVAEPARTHGSEADG
ncbi:alpha/beta hydrolase [Polymorphospora sp. NPDC051019]|uniref:alpha/beta fold hydrolase n=1 Tax=Polymorphospora sp. NPDC051019 TaxID=3155725 RepID=UPI0034372776